MPQSSSCWLFTCVLPLSGVPDGFQSSVSLKSFGAFAGSACHEVGSLAVPAPTHGKSANATAHAIRLATTAHASAIASFLPVLDEPLPMLPTRGARSVARV